MTTALDALLVHVTDPRPGGRTKTWRCPRDLRFSVTAPGGFDSLSCTLTWPDPDSAPSDVLTAGSLVTVTDRTSGDTVWYGEVDDPGTKVRPNAARAYKMSATGARRLLERVTRAYALCDRNLDNWTSDHTYPQAEPTTGDGSGFVAHGGDWPTDAPDGYIEGPGPDGTKLVTNSRMNLRYRPLAVSARASTVAMRAVWLYWSHRSDAARANTVNEFLVRDLIGGVATVNSAAQSATQLDESGAYGFGAWTVEGKVLFLRWRYTGAATTRSGDDWTRFANVAVYFQVYDKDGNLLSPSGSVTSLHVGGIMHDMLGRHLLGLVETGSTVLYPTTPAIDQAEWWGGASAREIADFCQTAQPDYWWAVWEPGPSGLPRFEYRPWIVGGAGVLTNAFRYHLSRANTRVEFAGGQDDVFNSALVVYQRKDGVPASVEVSGDVADLTARGVERMTTVDLTDRGPLSAGAATNLGLSELAKLDAERASGTATVTGPVIDRVTGVVVDPWSILPGWLAKTAEPPEQSYPGNDLTRRDSVSQFRVTGVTFDAASNSAELTLDGGARSVFRRRRGPAAVLPGRPRLGDSPTKGQTPIKRK